MSIPQPPWTSTGKKMESKCRKALFDFSMLDHTAGLAIALSGGKDSLSLLFMLKAILGRGFPDLPLTALHVSGEFSCGASLDSGFLQTICNGLRVPLLISEPEKREEKTLACYSCSRERRKLLFNAAKKKNISTIAFGHHQDDSIQTLLLNLLHKGEFAAMLPKILMRDYQVTIIRPLIYIPEQEITTFAKQYGFARVTCRCPVGSRSKRSTVKQLLTQIEEVFPHASSNLALASHTYGSKKAMKL